MKKTIFASGVLLVATVCAVPVFAADSGLPPMDQTRSFAERQTEILKIIDARAAGIQDERSCVQAARDFDDLKACRDKAMAEMGKRRTSMMGRGPGDNHTPPPGL